MDVEIDQLLNDERIEQFRGRLAARAALPDPHGRRVLRESVGASLEEIAEVVGVTKAAVSLWERGAREPASPNLERYIAVLRLMALGGR